MAKPGAPALLPVFRSRLVGDLLALLLADLEREWTIDELAKRTDTAYPTVTREIRLLQEAELVRTRTIGRSKLVHGNAENPSVGPLAELAIGAFGPPQVIAEEFGGVPGVEQILIYGSWAARRAGQSGPPPHDVDVLILGRPDRDDIYDATRRAEDRLGREVNATIRSKRAWENADDAFAQTVKSAPLLDLSTP